MANKGEKVVLILRNVEPEDTRRIDTDERDGRHVLNRLMDSYYIERNGNCSSGWAMYMGLFTFRCEYCAQNGIPFRQLFILHLSYQGDGIHAYIEPGVAAQERAPALPYNIVLVLSIDSF